MRSIEPEAISAPVGSKRAAKISPVWPIHILALLQLWD